MLYIVLQMKVTSQLLLMKLKLYFCVNDLARMFKEQSHRFQSEGISYVPTGWELAITVKRNYHKLRF